MVALKLFGMTVLVVAIVMALSATGLKILNRIADKTDK
jgi:hypothetical protein